MSIDDIKNDPAAHQHDDMSALIQCCRQTNGVVDFNLLQAHQLYAPLGQNGGVNCDVRKGPCSCGAWH